MTEPSVREIHQKNFAQTVANQSRAADPSRSAWVSANAGSGKTRVLTDRVIRLLLAATPPSKILCLTFTKAAAGEMANRLFKRLGTWTTLPDGELIDEIEKLIGERIEPEGLIRARRLFARALETPGGLKIQTIHAFAQSVLTRFPLEARISPHFEVIDERTSGELLFEAMETVFDQAGTGADDTLKEAVEDLTLRLDQNGLLSVLREVVAARQKIERAFEDHDGAHGAAMALRIALGLKKDDSEASVLAASRGVIDTNAKLWRQTGEDLFQGAKSDRERGEGILQFLSQDPGEASYQDYVALFLTTKGAPRKTLVTKGLQKKHPDLEHRLRQEQNRVLEVEAKCKAVLAAEATQSLLIFAQHLLRQFEDHKSRRGVLDYDDLIAKASLLLTKTSAAWVHFKLDGGIEHILVDEAQDTSPEQWRIIEHLSTDFFSGLGVHEEQGQRGARTIFAVGDEKQSIYSFQGADPDEFERKRQLFEKKVSEAKQEFSTLDLILSFRSTSEILSSVDQVFADASLSQGLTSAGLPLKHEAHRLGVQGLVELWPTIAPVAQEVPDAWDAPLDRVQPSAPRAVLADKIADTIDEWIQTKQKTSPNGKEIEPGDILILVQRRDSFVDEMIRALKKRDIPVAGRDRMVLIDQLVVMDLLALVEFALLPEDDLTLAVVLKSPLIGFDDEALFELAHGRSSSLWQCLVEKKDDTDHFAKAYHELSAVLSRVETSRPFEFLTRALGAGAQTPVTGRERLLSRLGLEASDPIDELLNLALAYERIEVPSLQGFLRWVREDASEIKRDFDLISKEVRIMTVHGAKGLEGRIVILPDTCSTPNSRHDPEILSLAAIPGAPLVWRQSTENQDDLSAAARERLAQRRREEHLRLLYVAMTRAKDRLYLCGYETQKGRSQGCWYDLIEEHLKPLMSEQPDSNGELIWQLREDHDPDLCEQEEQERVARKSAESDLPAWVDVNAAAEEAPAMPLAPSRLAGQEAPLPVDGRVISPLEAHTNNRFQRGLLVHKLLQHLPDVALKERAESARRYLSLPAHGLDQKEIDDTLAEVMAILSDPTFAPIFGPGSLAETPLVGRLPDDGRLLSGQVDRLLVTPEQILIIDYKTNRPPPSQPEQVSPLYVRQMAAYRALLQEIYPGRPVTAALLWTVGPHLMILPEDVMATALNSI